MPQLKFRAVYGKELEIEGEENLVLELIDRYYLKGENASAGTARVDNLSTTLLDVVYKTKARTEAEWLVVYAYLIDKQQFKRNDLLDAYRTSQRYTENRRKSLSFSIKGAVKQGWINIVSPTDYSLSPEGRLRAEELLG